MRGAEGAAQDDAGSPAREACRVNDAAELDGRTRFDNGTG